MIICARSPPAYAGERRKMRLAPGSLMLLLMLLISILILIFSASAKPE